MSRLNFEIQITVTPTSEWFQEGNTAQECLSHYDSEYLNEFPGRKKMDCWMCSKITKCSTGKSEIFRSVRYWGPVWKILPRAQVHYLTYLKHSVVF